MKVILIRRMKESMRIVLRSNAPAIQQLLQMRTVCRKLFEDVIGNAARRSVGDHKQDYGTMKRYSTRMTSIFTKIINREIPGHFIYEDEFCVAILDKFPAVKGQSLVIPKKDIDYAFDLDDDSYIHLFRIAKKIAKASDRALGAARTCLAVEGFEVPHVHIKIYPMQDTQKALGAIMAEGREATDDELSVVATQILAALQEEDVDEA